MKVFHLTSVHVRHDNRILNKQCKSLAQHFDTTLVVADGEGGESFSGVTIMDVGKPSSRINRMLFKTFLIFNLARKHGADVFQIHDPELLPLGFLYTLFGKKVIYDIHEDYITSISIKSYLPARLRKMTAILFGGIERLLSFKMHRLIAEKYYSKRFPDSLPILNYPAKKDLIGVDAFNEESSTLIYTGNVTSDRGAVIISNMAKKEENYQFKLVGKCTVAVYRKISVSDIENLELVGLNRYIPFDEIITHYQQGVFAGLALFPASQHYAEKELTKFFEYMAVGLPIIASDFPVWRDLIEGNGVGICVDINKVENVLSAIQELKENPKKTKEMGLRGKALVKSSLNWETEFTKLLNLYKELEGQLEK